MSATKRVQQWLTFNRLWWLYDAKWQDPYKSGEVIGKYLKGEHKPIYGGHSDCGDHVVVINCAHIALKADEWYYRVYFHHTGYPGGATWTKAYEVHQKNPTMIMQRAVRKGIPNDYHRKFRIPRLHLFPEDKIPPKIAENISDQIRPLRVVPKRLDHYTKEEVDSFPKLFDYPDDYILADPLKGKIIHKF